jgi:hypothetical protein
MRCRVVSPFHDGKANIGYIWLDCEFDLGPNSNEQLRFFPYEMNATVVTVVTAISGFVHPHIDIVAYTTMVRVNLSTNSLVDMAETQGQLSRQNWTWIRERKLGTPSHESDDDRAKHDAWLIRNDLPPVSSMAFALTDARNASVRVCRAEKLPSGDWAIRA